MATDLRTTALTALASIPADPANLLLYVADLTEALPDNQSKKMALTLLDSRFGGGALLAANNLSDLANVATARTNLGLAIGTNVQAYDAFLTSIALLGTAADKMIYTTGVDVAAETALTPFARSILDDANEAAFKATVNLEIGIDVQAWDADLDTLAGLAKTDGNFIVGDGAAWTVESGATARASLGLTIGTNVQAWDADLDTLAGLAKTDGNFIVGDGAAWVVESGATARTSLGLGTIATQNANSVTISGGSITGITDLAIADGGTGQSTAQAAIDALSNVAAATNEHVLTKDTASGNAIFKAAPATGAPVGAKYIVQQADGTLTNEQALGALATGLLKNTTTSGVLSIAAEGTDYFNPPFLDTNALVKGSADATKLLRFEVDGFTAGATRVMTPPNANATIAGLEVANVFTAAQTIQHTLTIDYPSDNNKIYLNTNDTDGYGSEFSFNYGGVQKHTLGASKNSGIYLIKIADVSGAVPWILRPSTGQMAVAPSTSLPEHQFSVGVNFDLVGLYLEQISYNTKHTIRATLHDLGDLDIFTVGTVGHTTARVRNSDTNIVADAIVASHATDGAVAANFGTAIALKGESSTTEDRDMARLAAIWDAHTDASRSAALKVLISGTSEVDAAKFDDDATAGNTRLFVYDVDNGQLERVSVGIADSGGVGFKLLRIAN